MLSRSLCRGSRDRPLAIQLPEVCPVSDLVGPTNKGCCYDRGGFPGGTLDRVRKYGVNAQELVTTSSTRLLMTT